jgi:hypothetical protein
MEKEGTGNLKPNSKDFAGKAMASGAITKTKDFARECTKEMSRIGMFYHTLFC